MIQYSVIIPTYNGAGVILKPLHALLRQSISPKEFEIIIVDDGSTDKTAEVVNNFKTEYPDRNIVYIRKKNGGPASARNVGLKYVRGEIIFFTDDDCEPPFLWMEKILKVYKNHNDIVGAGGWYNSPSHELRTNIFHQFYYVLHRYSFGLGLDFFRGKTGEYDPWPAINTANISFYRWIFEKVGKFNTSFRVPSLEDLEFCRRVQAAGFNLYYLPLHVVHHKHLTLKKFINLCIIQAKGKKVYRHVTATEHEPLWPPIIRGLKEFRRLCGILEKKNSHFHYDRRILFLFLMWFSLRNVLIKCPFFYKIS